MGSTFCFRKKNKKYLENLSKTMYIRSLAFLWGTIGWYSVGQASKSNNVDIKINNKKISLNRVRNGAPWGCLLVEMQEK